MVIFIIPFIAVSTFGCSDASKDNKTIVYASQSKNSAYEKRQMTKENIGGFKYIIKSSNKGEEVIVSVYREI
ncbi:MAG TPA: hypothetical protein VJ962_13160 [Clostridia bacterium]|nr:hypothetical protein [Clostridia bacterium]